MMYTFYRILIASELFGANIGSTLSKQIESE